MDADLSGAEVHTMRLPVMLLLATAIGCASTAPVAAVQCDPVRYWRLELADGRYIVGSRTLVFEGQRYRATYANDGRPVSAYRLDGTGAPDVFSRSTKLSPEEVALRRSWLAVAAQCRLDA